MSDRVLVRASFFDECDIERQIIESQTEAYVCVSYAETPEELAKDTTEADAVAVLNPTGPTPASFFKQVSGLRVLATYSVGVNHISVDAATTHGVAVVNVPGYCADEVSTHAMALLLACVRKITRLDSHVRNGGWDWSILVPTHRLRGRTLGLVGFGNIPRRVAEKAAGFGVDIVATDPFVTPRAMADYDVEKVEFEDLLERSQYLSIHTPLTEETRHLFDAEVFDRLRQDSILVNTSRGAVVDENALYDALVAGPLAAAGLDVMENEPPEGSPLFDLENVILSPHAGAYSKEAHEEVRRRAAMSVARVLNGERPEELINPEVLA